MGRMVSCRTCGAWGEISPEVNPRGWQCDDCSGAAHRGDASRDELQTPQADRAPPSGRPARPSADIGRDSGAIGSSSTDTLLAGLGTEPESLRRRAESTTIGTASADAVATSKEAPRRGRGPSEQLGRRAADEARRQLEDAVTFARRQADETIERAESLVSRQGPIEAARGAGQFAQDEMHRIGQQVQELAEQKARSAAQHAAEVTQRKLDETEQRLRRVVQRQVPTAHPAEPQRATAEQGSYRLAPEPRRPTPTAGPASGKRCAACGESVSPRALVCPKCGRWLHHRAKSRQELSRSSETMPKGCSSAIAIAVAVVAVILFLRGCVAVMTF